MHHKPHLREVEEELNEVENDAQVDMCLDQLPASEDLVLLLYGRLLLALGIIAFVWLLVLIPLLLEKVSSPIVTIISGSVVVVSAPIIGVYIEQKNIRIIPVFILLLLIFAAIAWFCVIKNFILASAVLIFLIIAGILAAVRLYNTALKGE